MAEQTISTDLEPTEPITVPVPTPTPTPESTAVARQSYYFTVRTTQEILAELRQFSGIIYGESGVGKTRLASTVAQIESQRDVVAVDLESGILSGATNPIDVFEGMKSWTEVARFKELLAVYCRNRDKAPDSDMIAWQIRNLGPGFGDRARRWRTLIFESLTNVHRLAMNKVLRTEISQTDLDSEPAYIDRADWGKALTMILRLMSELRELPLDIIYTAGEQVNELKSTGVHKTTLQLPGQAASQVQREVQVVGRLIVGYKGDEIPVRRLLLQRGPNHDAKCRIPGMDDIRWVDDPKMIDLIQPLKALGTDNNNGT